MSVSFDAPAHLDSVDTTNLHEALRAVIFEFRRQPWMEHAACAGMDFEVFFPERGQSVIPAQAVCAGCAVRSACLEYALAINERHGIWGGTSERERRVLRRQRGGSRPGRRRRPGTGLSEGPSVAAERAV
jgi:WhiB family redox-sensing transcriptional regulator